MESTKQRLTAKGDEPITGNDMAKVLEEITTILGDLQYLDDAPNVFKFKEYYLITPNNQFYKICLLQN